MQHATPTTLRIRIEHDHPLVRHGLAQVLSELASVELLPDGPAGGAADIVVADACAGMGWASAAKNQGPYARPAPPKVVIVGGWRRDQDVRLALQAGVSGLLRNECSSRQVTDCILQVAAGGRYVDMGLLERVADTLSQEPLTRRECDVLQVMATGSSNKAIALELGISTGTVKAHLKAIMAKLRATSRTEAASIALKQGLVDGPGAPKSVATRWAGPAVNAPGVAMAFR